MREKNTRCLIVSASKFESGLTGFLPIKLSSSSMLSTKINLFRKFNLQPCKLVNK